MDVERQFKVVVVSVIVVWGAHVLFNLMAIKNQLAQINIVLENLDDAGNEIEAQILEGYHEMLHGVA